MHVRGSNILGSWKALHGQKATMIGTIFRDTILKQCMRLFRGAYFLFMDDSVRLYRESILNDGLKEKDITRL